MYSGSMNITLGISETDSDSKSAGKCLKLRKFRP